MADGKEVGIDTGTPGFDIDGKSYTMDPVPLGDPGVEPIPTSRGDMSVDDEVKDISKATRETMATYLGKYTTINRFAVDGTAVDVSITTTKGLPSPIKPTENTQRFAEPQDVGNHTTLKEDPRATLVGTVSVGRGDPSLPDGHTLLKVPEEPVKRYVSTLLANNRFSSVDDRSFVEDASAPSKSFDPELYVASEGERSSLSRMSQVGSMLTLRASQELGSTVRGAKPTDGRTEAGALLPGLAQLGASRVNVDLLTARDVLADLTKSDAPDAALISVSGLSWGNLNNVHDRFSGFQALGMIGLSVALTSVVVVAFEGVAALVGLISTSPAKEKTTDGRYPLGSSIVEKYSNPSAVTGLGNLGLGSNVASTLLGIRPTVKPFSQALKKGIEVFFGFDGSIRGGLKQSVQAPGYNAVVARAIIRSSLSVLEAMKNVGNSTNLVSGAKNVLNVVETLRGSKFIAAINVFAQLGDQELTVNEDDIVKDDTGTKLSRIDAIPDNVPGFAVMKNRLNNGRSKLAWANNNSPSTYLLPTRILGLSLTTKLGGFQTGYGLQEQRTRARYKLLETSENSPSSNRIPYSSQNVDDVTVKAIEQQLEAEYVPFYFHDVRTNEIISFHAFLTALSENYQPGYEETQGFGRTEPVRIYKSTNRVISLSFMIVATSEDDFNDMWVKINKLITLVYPQYTQGRTLSTDGYEFVQPFSQMMGASPMMRLRLGDLIKGNYSRFALARLFGAGTKETLKLDNNLIDFKLTEDQVKQKVEELKKTQRSGWYAANDGVTVGSLAINLPAFGSVSTGFAQTMKLGPDAQFLPVTIDGFVDGGEAVIVKPQVISEADLRMFYGLSEADARAKVSYLKSLYDNPSAPRTRIVGGKYKIVASALRMTPMLAKTFMDSLSSTSTEQVDALHTFMSPENNALVRSFDSVKGKGLAGFIGSLDLDWYTNVLWETALPGQKAPRSCTVTLTYLPIHDVAPGIDHVGMNRAPVYPVGFYNHGFDEKE